MPTQSDLQKIAALLYDKPINASGWTNNLKYNGKASQYGLPEPDFTVWSGEESFIIVAHGDYPAAKIRGFNTTETDWTTAYRDNSSYFGLCLAE